MYQLSDIKDFKLKNFVPFYPRHAIGHLQYFLKRTCFSDHNSDFKDHLCWHDGSDYSVINYKKEPTHCHPGIHYQEHVADFFYGLYSQNNSIV
jgi:hypothetical protein